MKWEIAQIKQKLKEGFIVIKVDRHEARKTSAYTRWSSNNAVYNIYDTYANNKTHWEEFWLVKPDDILFRIRKSNKGNVSVDKYTAVDLKISDAELEQLLIALEEERNI